MFNLVIFLTHKCFGYLTFNLKIYIINVHLKVFEFVNLI